MYLLSSIPHVVTLVAPTFANLFMRVSIWLPFEAAGIILVTTVLLIWLMPESLKPQPPVANADQYPQLDGAIRNPDENDSLFPGNRVETERDQRLENAWLKVPREVLALFRIPTVPSILVMFFLKPLCFLSEGFTYQYASESFHWKISQTTWLRVSQAVGSAIVTVIILPILYVLLNHRGFQHQMLDLGVIRWSFGIAIVGFGMLWLAKVGWVLVLGMAPNCKIQL